MTEIVRCSKCGKRLTKKSWNEFDMGKNDFDIPKHKPCNANVEMD